MPIASVRPPMHPLRRGLAAVGLGAALAASSAAPAQEAPQVRFGVQPWPGVTVKSEVAMQLLDAAGHRTKKVGLNTPLTLEGLSNGDLEVALGGWYPVSSSMINPLVEEGKVTRLAANLPNALSGVAVPEYVHEAGVDSMSDLHRYRERFGGEVYGIEAGSTWNNGVKEAIEADRHNLGDWELVASGTTAMLAQVGRSIEREEWIAFYGWTPHWMNITYDLYYLEAPEGSKIAHTEATVYTLVPPEVTESHPNVVRFLRNYAVEPQTQSRWIYEHSYEERPEDEVAREWIANNPETVRQWLEGVETVDGGPAFEAVQAEYGY